MFKILGTFSAFSHTHRRAVPAIAMHHFTHTCRVNLLAKWSELTCDALHDLYVYGSCNMSSTLELAMWHIECKAQSTHTHTYTCTTAKPHKPQLAHLPLLELERRVVS